MECWKLLVAGLWIAWGVECARDCSEVSDGAMDQEGNYYEVAVELTVCCNETDLIATLLLGRNVVHGDSIFLRVVTTITCYDELNNVTLEKKISYDREEKISLYACKIGNSSVRCDVSTLYLDEASFYDTTQEIATSCVPNIVPETTDTTPVETTDPTPTDSTTDPIPVETTADPTPVETTNSTPVETTVPTPSDEERNTSNGHNVQVVTIVVLTVFGSLICLSIVMASILFIACKWYCLQRSSKHRFMQDYSSEMTEEKAHIDFNYKFPVTLSLDSIVTVTVPMGNHLLSSWRSESNSSIWKYDGHSSSTDLVNKLSSSGSYLSICEDCKCKSNNKEVCDCDLHNEPPDCISAAWNTSRDNSAMEEDHSLDRKSVVTVAPGELRTELHNDSGIECGFV